ncbi:hypothetical protein [Kitasatospora sp. NPDC017646]
MIELLTTRTADVEPAVAEGAVFVLPGVAPLDLTGPPTCERRGGDVR